MNRSLIVAALALFTAHAASAAEEWKDAKLSPDARATAWVSAMTLDEKIRLIHGYFASTDKGTVPKEAIVAAGYVPGIPRLGIPALFESDASLGVANQMDSRKGDVATALPAGLATAASFDTQLAHDGGAMIGSEARSKGFNVLLAGGVNLTREPRNGRNFEYLGEDPWLAGKLAGAAIRGVQSNAIASTIKHFALNAQESGRAILSADIDEAPFRESDLLAFEIAIEDGAPASVMCGYNRVNGIYACENPTLLNDVLKRDWSYRGWVMSDWGAVHGVVSAIAGGLDQESGEELDSQVFFGAPLMEALKSKQVTQAQIDAMVHRILRSIIAVGLIEKPVIKGAIDYASHALVAQHTAEAGAVLLKNDKILPLRSDLRRIILVGGHADVGVLSGGGSSQVRAVAGTPVELASAHGESAGFCKETYHGSSPLAALRARYPAITFAFDDGTDPKRSAAAVKGADLAIVFATQWNTEASDVPDLTLPNHQDALIDAVARANGNTIVVLETGNPVLMPWLGRVKGVLEAWYPGEKGGEAIARLLSGDVSPSGHLPMTFPARVDDLPRKTLDGYAASIKAESKKPEDKLQQFNVRYDEGADVGYRWYTLKGKKPLFPFGFGLSYTTFAFENFKVDGKHVTVDVVNTGKVEGSAAPQIYAKPPSGQARLVGFAKVKLAPGERKQVSLDVDQRLLSKFDTTAHDWLQPAGSYAFAVRQNATDKGLSIKSTLPEARRAP